MNRPQKTKFVVALGGAFLAFSALAVNAAGLGKLSVNSALGQPLSAEIELVSLQPGEFESISGRVASPESYGEARIEYSPLLRQLRFATERRANGTPILRILSNAPINEPFLDVLVEMNWPSGRLLREYPILLDPPGFNEARIATPVASVTTVKPAASVASTTTATAAVASAPIKGSPSAKTETGGDTYGPVKRGDTLSKIAKEMKPDTVSLEQMLVALYRENKTAFTDSNMNRLRTGQILRVPSATDVANVSATEARSEIKVQVANWNAYREQVAAAASTASPKVASNEATGKITVAKPDAPLPAATPKDQLKIAKTDGASTKVGGAGAGGGVQDQLNALKEEKIVRENALKEANSRVGDLEKQIATMRKLAEVKGLAIPADTKVAVKSDDKAAPKIDAKPAPATPLPVPPADIKVAQVTPAIAPVIVPAVTAIDPAKDLPKADVKLADVKPEPPKTEPVVIAKPADVKPAPPKVIAPPPESNFLEDNALLALGTGAVALLGIGGLFLSRRKKTKPIGATGMSKTSSIMPSDLKPNTITGNKSGGLVDTGNSSFLTDFDKTGPGSIDTDEVDPLAEADVYIAYGRDAQAEEILKEALGRDKSRHEITLKLLEIYHNRKSTQAFETVAREFKESVGVDHPHWVKVAAMGAAIDPQNTLYSGSGAAYATTGAFVAAGAAAVAATSAEHAPPPDLDFDLGFSDAPAQASSVLDISSPNTTAATKSGGSNFDLDLNSSVGPASHADIGLKPGATAGGLDFDLALDAPAAAASAAATKAAPAAFDFDLSALSLDEPSHLATQKMSAAPQEFAKTIGATPKSPSSFSEFSLDLDAPAASPAGESSAVATKLELAKAYVEIGDRDGARDILHEVAREGSAAQQAEAKKLIAGL